MGRARGGIAAIASQPIQGKSTSCRARLEDSTAFSATIEFVMFPRNGKVGEDGFTIAKAIHEGTGEKIILKGKFGPVSEGELISLAKGVWRDDSRYGEFFQVWSRSHSDPVTREALLGYLDKLPGVGPVLAQAIIDTHGLDCLDKIDKDPSLLLNVKTSHGRHLNPADLEEIRNKWDSLRSDRKNMLYLSSIGIGDATAKRISAHFGLDCQKVIQANPYAMTQVEGVGFRIADMVASKLGIKGNDPRRLAAGMEYLLQEAESGGHVCLSRDEMLERAPKLLARGTQHPSEDQLNKAIDSMVEDGRLWAEEREGTERIYTTEMYVIETRLYQHLEEMLTGIDDPNEIPGYITPPENSMLTEEQYQALWRARNYRLSLLTGGPGCGKSFSMSELLDDLDSRGESYVCLAPTGKAAKRMQELTGRDAQTIHRKLGFTGRENPRVMIGSGLSADDRPFEEDVVIVDEASMLDMRLAERLFSHLKPETRVVLVGDPDQLPAVGAGSVLLDLIESERVPRTHLTKIFRQSVAGKNAASLLIANAARIRDGKEPYWSKAEAEKEIQAQQNNPQAEVWEYIPPGTEVLKDDFRFTEEPDPDKALKKVMKLTESLAAEFDVPVQDVMVTAPTRKGGTGIYILNKKLQQERNPNGLQFRDGDQPLRIGDRVMNTKNRYGKKNLKTGDFDPDIMNGDIGVVTGYNPQTKVATVDFDEGTLTYASDELDALIPSYAATTHKLQGSEAPAIICPYTGSAGSWMLSRQLIYTAVTRGKQLAEIVGDKDVIREALKRDGSKRNTTLDLRIGAIPKLLKERYRRVQNVKVASAQQLLGGYASNRLAEE